MTVRDFTRALAVSAALFVTGFAAPTTAQTFEVSPPASEAARLFQKVCVANQRRLDGGIAALERLAFIYDADEDIYFHPTYDMSFSIRTRSDDGQWYCSMVWSSSDPLAANINAIAAISPEAETPDFFNTALMRTRIYGTN